MSRPLPYIEQSRLDEAELAISKYGTPAERVAAQLGLSVDELNVLLGRPQWKSIPADDDGGSVDLWAAEDVL